MRITTFLGSVAVLSLAVLFTGCDSMSAHNHAGMWANVNKAACVIYPTKGQQVSGTLTFETTPDGAVHIMGTISGLAPNSVHAMHIHEFGDQRSDNGTAAGGHYNPEVHNHGDVTNPDRHAGDLGNIKADESGKALVHLIVTNISVAGMKDPIIGRAVVIHEKADEFSQPVGNAGGRIGVGVIGIANPTVTTPAP